MDHHPDCPVIAGFIAKHAAQATRDRSSILRNFPATSPDYKFDTRCRVEDAIDSNQEAILRAIRLNPAKVRNLLKTQ